MNEQEWFLSEFGQYGFSLSPTIYDPLTFAPCKAVMVIIDGRCSNTNIRITPELANDIHGWGVPNDHHVEGLRELVRMEIRRQYPNIPFKYNDFTPKKELKKLNINRW